MELPLAHSVDNSVVGRLLASRRGGDAYVVDITIETIDEIPRRP
jgi:hypothetical protein